MCDYMKIVDLKVKEGMMVLCPDARELTARTNLNYRISVDAFLKKNTNLVRCKLQLCQLQQRPCVTGVCIHR